MELNRDRHRPDVLTLSHSDLAWLAKGNPLELNGLRVVLDSVVSEARRAITEFMESGKKPDMIILSYAKVAELSAEYTEHFMGATIYGYGGDRIIVSGV